MNKKILAYTLGIMLLAGSVVQMQRYRLRINTLEKQIVEYENVQIESKEILKSDNTDKDNTTEVYYGNYQGNSEFSDIIKSNSIDRDYAIELKRHKESSRTTLEWGAMQQRYTERWQEMINTSLIKLYGMMSEEDSLNLQEAQKSWLTSMEHDLAFVANRFIDTKYLGTQGMVQMSEVKLERTRIRAIELMEFIFIIDREALDFVSRTK